MFLDDIVNIASQSIFRYEEALAYLHSRKISDEVIKEYRLGFNKIVSVPQDNHSERSRFLDESFRGRKYENRLLLPITDVFNRVVGLSGRSIGTKDFKTFVLSQYKENGYFFGLPQAISHIYSSGRVFVVEGYFDVFALRILCPNTVSSLTSTLSDVQYEYLSYYCDDIIVMLDADKAGRFGMHKVEEKFKVKTIDIGYEDPAKCYEKLSLADYKKYMTKKIRDNVLL